MGEFRLEKLKACKECGLKPKIIIFAHGYSDKDDEAFRQCPKCKKRTPEHAELLPKAQEIQAQIDWNKMN